MNEDLYYFLKGYVYDNHKEGYKVNKDKNTLTIYGNTSVVLWIFGILFLAWSVVSFIYTPFIMALVLFAIAVFGFFMPLTKRTVFDLGKKEIRQDTFFITGTKIKPEKIANYHTTIVKINGLIKSSVFDIEYYAMGEYNAEKKSIMKGVACFKTMKDLMDFQPVVTMVLNEMK